MNVWLAAAIWLLALALPAGLATLRGDVIGRVVAMQLTSTLVTLALVLLAQAFDRDVYFDLAVVTGLLSFVGTLLYVHVLEAWL